MERENTSIRLKKIMSDRNLRQVDILELCKPYCAKYNIKLGRNDLSQYVSGKVEPGQKKLTILGMALNVNEAWLMGFDVPMERDNYTDQNLMNRDAIIEDIDRILQKDGYVLLYETTDDDYFIIKKSYGQTVAGFYDYELIPRYDALRKKGKVTADLLIASETSFFRYLESIGYYIGRDNLEHKPYIQYNNGAIVINDNILNSIRTRIDTYSKTTIDSIILKLHEENIREKRVKKEQFAQSLLSAAHERTDIEVTDEMRQHDDDIMNDDSEWE
ncbi:MAG: hypothetical protein Q4C77_10415 [Eubacteriales bacterium]|nr:hypothetical protein [Eubacteriales bacterium]